MRLFIIIALIYGQIHLACAQTNPFRMLRDGDSRFITPRDEEASKRFLQPASALPVVKSYFDNFEFLRFNKAQFFEKVALEPFFKHSVKLCRLSFKNVVFSCEKLIKENLIVQMRKQKIIDDVVYLLLQNHLEHPYQIDAKNKHSLALDLPSLEQKYFFIELKREVVNPTTATQEFLSNPMGGKVFKSKFADFKKLTPRQRLYLNYSHEQIIKLAEIVKYASLIMNAKDIKLVIDVDGDGVEDLPAIETSYSEKYRLALKLIKRELNREMKSGILIGKNPNFTDLLAASMEAGYFSPDELKIMLDFPELRDPKPETMKKVGRIAWLITRTGIMAIPGFGTIAAIPIVIIEAIIEGNKKKNEKADTTDDLF